MESQSTERLEDTVESSESSSSGDSGDDDISGILSSDDNFDPEEYRRNRRKQFEEQQFRLYKMTKEKEKMMDDAGNSDSDAACTDILSSSDTFDPEEYRRNRRKQFEEKQFRLYTMAKKKEKMKDDAGNTDSDDEDGDVSRTQTGSGNSVAGLSPSVVPFGGSRWVEEMARKAQDIPEELFTQPLKKTKRVHYDSSVMPVTPKDTGRNEGQQIYTSTPFVGATAHSPNADLSMSPIVRNPSPTNVQGGETGDAKDQQTKRKENEQTKKSPVVINDNPPASLVIQDAEKDDVMPSSEPLPEDRIADAQPNISRIVTAGEAASHPIQTSSSPTQRITRATKRSIDSVRGVRDVEVPVALHDGDEAVTKNKKAKLIPKKPAIKLPTVKKPGSVVSPVAKAPEDPPSKEKRKIEEKSEQDPKSLRTRLQSKLQMSEPLVTDLESTNGSSTLATAKPVGKRAPKLKTTKQHKPSSAPAASTAKASDSKTGRKKDPEKTRYVGNDVMGNYHMINSKQFKDLLQSTHPNLRLDQAEMNGIKLKLNHFLEDFFVHHCNESRLPRGFITFKCLKNALIEQCLVDENATDAEFAEKIKDFNPQEFEKYKELGMLVPKPGNSDTIDFLFG